MGLPRHIRTWSDKPSSRRIRHPDLEEIFCRREFVEKSGLFPRTLQAKIAMLLPANIIPHIGGFLALNRTLWRQGCRFAGSLVTIKLTLALSCNFGLGRFTDAISPEFTVAV